MVIGSSCQWADFLVQTFMNAAYTYSYLQQLKLYIIKRWCDVTVWINFGLQNRYASTLNWLFWLVGWLVPQKSKARKPHSLCTYSRYIQYTIPVPGGTYQSVSTVPRSTYVVYVYCTIAQRTEPWTDTQFKGPNTQSSLSSSMTKLQKLTSLSGYSAYT